MAQRILVRTLLITRVNSETDRRQLLQNRKGREIIVSEKNADLNKVIGQATARDTLLLETEKVMVNELLTIEVDELHIKGASTKDPVIIQCTGPDSRIDIT